MTLPPPARETVDRRALVDLLVGADPEAARRRDEIRVVRAPARVNLVGEHTDYNEGLVLPAAISLELAIAFIPTDDGRVELTLASTGERGAFDLGNLGDRHGSWLDYVAGTAWALRQAGAPVRGFHGVLTSTIPLGAGLSSSAAIELASAWALSGGQRPSLEPMALAQTAQRAENEYVGVMCGLMDQFAITMGQPGQALLLDCRSLEWHAVPIPPDLELVVCHSGSPRSLDASEYNARRAECAGVAAAIAEHEPGIRSLRDVSTGLLERHRSHVGEVAYRRALHVVTENERVTETEAALRTGDHDRLGVLFADSHASLRDRFEVSSDALDALVGIAVATPGVVAARLTGAGFGGCTINLVERGHSDALRVAVAERYPVMTGLTPRVYVVDAVEGAGFAG